METRQLIVDLGVSCLGGVVVRGGSTGNRKVQCRKRGENCNAGVDPFVDVHLIHIRQQGGRPDLDIRIIGRGILRVSEEGIVRPLDVTNSQRKLSVHIMIVVQGQAHLLHVVAALRAAGGFSCLLNRG